MRTPGRGRVGRERAGWIDVSVELRTGMVHWPDNPPVRIERTLDMGCGDPCTVSTLAMGSHTGTHMDAPAHFVKGGAGIDVMPIDATVGRARVIEIANRKAVRAAEIEPHRIRRGERILLKTRNSKRCWKTDAFVEDFVFIAEDAARFLAERGVRCVGTDYLSVAGYHESPVPTHRALLEAGIWIIEGLDLSRVPAGKVDLVCLPLRIHAGDGAPARAIVRPR